MITPMLWFEQDALAAARAYAAAFADAGIGAISHYGSEGTEIHGQPDGQVMVVNLTLAGLKLNLLNGGPLYKPNSAISFFVQLTSREAVDNLWRHLNDGGKTLMALDAYPWSAHYGWTADRYGFNWQIMLVDPPVSQTITPLLMFSDATRGRAEEAINLYCSLFANSGPDLISRYGGDADFAHMINHGRFHLGRQNFMAMDSYVDHGIGFTEAISLAVNCPDQREIDRLWDALTADGGAPGRCGWLKDKFGVSWQIVPDQLDRLLMSPDKTASGRVMKAMLGMNKMNIAELENAASG